MSKLVRFTNQGIKHFFFIPLIVSSWLPRVTWLESHEGRACYLCCEVGRLAFVKPQQSLALLEDDFLRPASGVDSICFKESQAKVCGKQSAPWASLASADEEQP